MSAQNLRISNNTNLELSVVAPMHNEELCVREFCSRVDAALRQLSDSYEIIVVNDGSTDATSDILDELCEANPRLIHLKLPRSRGQCGAIDAGFQNSRGEHVVMMDGDLQHLPEEISLLVNEILRGFDLVSGTRQKRQESLLLRRIPSLVANYLLRSATGCGSKDMGGFKCLRGEVARSLHLRAGQHRLIPALVHLQGGSISNVPISAPPRFAGKSHYGISRSVDVALDIVLLWTNSAVQSKPLYLFGYLSGACLAVTGATLAWLTLDKLAWGGSLALRPATIALAMFSFASLLFFGAGLVLESANSLLSRLSRLGHSASDSSQSSRGTKSHASLRASRAA
ncbi:MAG: glycosyltransferase family 2 protein [Planctomycetia bacterium]|nr:glycosyltransferase family 2 protein [Planctomycetia bacterium]